MACKAVFKLPANQSCPGMVLIVVHDDQAVGAGGELAKIEVLVAHRYIDVQLQSASVQILAQLGDQCAKSGLRLERNLLEIDGCAFKTVGRQECQKLGAEILSRAGVLKKFADARKPLTASGGEVVDQGEDLDVGLLR